MINGKISDGDLENETFSFRELMEAVKVSPWVGAVQEWDENAPGGTPRANLSFAVRWLAEWIVLNKREHYVPGEVYVDARGGYFSYREHDSFPWRSTIDGEVFVDCVPVRPLRKLVPEGGPE